MARTKRIEVPNPHEDGYEPMCILRIGYGAKLCIPVQQGVEILAALSTCNLMVSDTWYQGNGKPSVEILKPFGSDEITLIPIGPAEILLRQANYEREQESKGDK